MGIIVDLYQSVCRDKFYYPYIGRSIFTQFLYFQLRKYKYPFPTKDKLFVGMIQKGKDKEILCYQSSYATLGASRTNYSINVE